MSSEIATYLRRLLVNKNNNENKNKREGQEDGRGLVAKSVIRIERGKCLGGIRKMLIKSFRKTQKMTIDVNLKIDLELKYDFSNLKSLSKKIFKF